MPAEEIGAVTLFDTGDKFGHADYAAHMTSEKQIEKFDQHRGTIVVWERINRNNHYFDAGYGSLAAADFVWRMKNARPRTGYSGTKVNMSRGDDRNFFVTNR